MVYSYVLQEDAQKDFETALKWYAERSVQAAENFIKSVEEALLSVCEYPYMWRNSYKDYHELGLKKYPFTIVYSIEAKKN